MTEKSGPLTPGVSREVVTEAGRRLWESYGGTTAGAAIRAIEQEARRLALAEVADELAANPEVLVSRDGIVANLRARLSEEAR